jgi:hypothetical protein
MEEAEEEEGEEEAAAAVEERAKVGLEMDAAETDQKLEKKQKGRKMRLR